MKTNEELLEIENTLKFNKNYYNYNINQKFTNIIVIERSGTRLESHPQKKPPTNKNHKNIYHQLIANQMMSITKTFTSRLWLH